MCQTPVWSRRVQAYVSEGLRECLGPTTHYLCSFSKLIFSPEKRGRDQQCQTKRALLGLKELVYRVLSPEPASSYHHSVVTRTLMQ